MGASTHSIASRLRQEFIEAAARTQIGGAVILLRLSELASACIVGESSEQDAVAFALTTIFQQYADEWDGSHPVTGDDTYRLLAMGDDCLHEAVRFVETGGGSEAPARSARLEG